MLKLIICWIFGHRMDMAAPLVEGVFEVCGRCGLRGRKIRDYEKEKK